MKFLTNKLLAMLAFMMLEVKLSKGSAVSRDPQLGVRPKLPSSSSQPNS
jgi:hypothetical protein